MIIMFFVSLMMIVSTDSRNAVSNIVYTNMVIFFIVAIYVIIEYYYNREFYRELNDVVESTGMYYIRVICTVIPKVVREHAHTATFKFNVCVCYACGGA